MRDGKVRAIDERASGTSREGGWAMLGLILALTLLGIVLASSVTPNVALQLQREKEAELLYRGQQIAEGIARYYNLNRLGPIQVQVPPPYGYLTELKKLRDGVTIGVNEFRFVRPSAMIDPMVNEEWEPIRARDPRIMPFLQAFAASNATPIPNSYLILAGPPSKFNPLHKDQQVLTPLTPGEGVGGGVAVVPPGQRRPADEDEDDEDEDDEDEDDEDEDDEDDEENGLDELSENDPLAGILEQLGKGNAPIIGVAPKKKGQSITAYHGLTRYEEWIFIYIPPPNLVNQQPQPQQRPQNQNRRRVAQ